MAGEAASALGLSMAVLAEHPDDAACEVAAEVVLGSPLVASELRDFAARCEVVTFDHEQVDLALVAALVDEGTIVRPGPATLEMAVDKAHMRTVLERAGIPVPAYAVVDPASADISTAVAAMGAGHGWPFMSKPPAAATTARVSGRWRTRRRRRLSCGTSPGGRRRGAPAARRRDRRHGGSAPSGDAVAWPTVETAQLGGVCREVLVPGRLPAEVLAQASVLAARWPISLVPSG